MTCRICLRSLEDEVKALQALNMAKVLGTIYWAGEDRTEEEMRVWIREHLQCVENAEEESRRIQEEQTPAT